MRLRVLTLFLNLEISMLFLSNVMSVNFRLLSTGAELDNSVGEESQKEKKQADPTTGLKSHWPACHGPRRPVIAIKHPHKE